MNYTGDRMRQWAKLLVIVGLTAAVAFAAKGPEYATGVLTSLSKTIRTRTTGYQVNTPLQRDDDAYLISVQVGTTVYSGEFIPYDEGTAFPEDAWHEGDSVQVRVEKHDLVMKRPSGRDIKIYIQKRQSAPALPAPPVAGGSKK